MIELHIYSHYHDAMLSHALKLEKKILTISEIIDDINSDFEQNYQSVWLVGEVSNFIAHTSGHFYFTLKDKKAAISAVMFKGYNRALKFQIENGLKIVVHGKLSIYEAQGRFQMIINHAEPDGLGALQLAFEQLKEKLENEGLFDEKRKKEIPLLPRKIGVITSLKGAAIRDIISVSQRRFPNIDILIHPVPVQGEGAAPEISKAINYFSQNKNVDVLIVGRGGGSIEDLWAFNEEVVARAIANCTIPIVSAVGHETDFTISDFVADLRAPTPSAAAEIVVPVKLELQNTIAVHKQRLVSCMNDDLKMKIKDLKLLVKSIPSPKNIYERNLLMISDLQERIASSVKEKLSEYKHSVEKCRLKLELLSPQNVLKRGFLMGKDESGKIITRKKQTKKGDAINLVFYDGDVDAEVL